VYLRLPLYRFIRRQTPVPSTQYPVPRIPDPLFLLRIVCTFPTFYAQRKFKLKLNAIRERECIWQWCVSPAFNLISPVRFAFGSSWDLHKNRTEPLFRWSRGDRTLTRKSSAQKKIWKKRIKSDEHLMRGRAYKSKCGLMFLQQWNMWFNDFLPIKGCAWLSIFGFLQELQTSFSGSPSSRKRCAPPICPYIIYVISTCI